MVCRTSAPLAVWNPWRNIAQFSQGLTNSPLEGLFDAVFGDQAHGSGPAFNVLKQGDDYWLEAEIPGLKVADLEISVQGQTVTVRGERIATEVPEKARIQRQERQAGSFTRTFKFPVRIDAQRTTATYEKGVLTVHAPALADDRPVKVSVRGVTNVNPTGSNS